MWDHSKNDADARFPPCYDELVVKEEKQVLPIAIIHLEAAKADAGTSCSCCIVRGVTAGFLLLAQRAYINAACCQCAAPEWATYVRASQLSRPAIESGRVLWPGRRPVRRGKRHTGRLPPGQLRFASIT